MDNAANAVDVPLGIFGGLNTELSPKDVPMGASPDNQDVVFIPGSLDSRPCLEKLFARQLPGNPTVVYARTYVKQNGDPLNLFLDSNGIVWQEDVNNSPGIYVQIGDVTPQSYCISTSAFGREYMAFSDGEHGVDIPRQYDGTYFDRVSQDGVGAGPGTVADSLTAGNISAGVHQCSIMFLTRQGYITCPSPPKNWTAAGNFKVDLTDIPIGPSNVIARIVAFTAAGGGNFFTILNPVVLPTAIAATVIADNTTTSATLDFTDNALLAATAIDIPGNNLFDLVPLGPVLGFFAYASRMFAWGERNKVTNFLNMAFDGGQNIAGTPLGWTVVGAGGTLDAASAVFGKGWLVTGDGVPANKRGQLTQPAYQDFWGIDILSPNTNYTFRAWIASSTAGAAGTVYAEFYSATGGGVLATASFLIANATAAGLFLAGDFDNATPAVIPADTVLRIYCKGQDNAAYVTLDELEIIYTDNPYLDTQMRASYVNNPESYDAVTGVIGPASDPSPIRAPQVIRSNMYLLTGERLHETVDNGTGEPSTWSINEVAEKCGALSAFGVDSGNDWFVWAARAGLQFFAGGSPFKLSQEIQPTWETIAFSAQKTIWVSVDQVVKRIYVGVPLGTHQTPIQIWPLDYRELETALQLPLAGLKRKWTRWNIPANCGAVLARGANETEFCLGGGTGGALDSLLGYGNVYRLNPDLLVDDDYGQVSPYWTSFFFVPPEGSSLAGAHRHLLAYLCFYATGVGNVVVTPLVGRLANAWDPTPEIPLSETQNSDIEVGMNVLSERTALKFAVSPVDGSRDVRLSIGSLVVSLKRDPWSPVKGTL